MGLPNKPQLAFAWIGNVDELWAAMKTTVVGQRPPRELMPRPSIYAAESEHWSYRFSCCRQFVELLDMRMHARRPSGVLWCCNAAKRPTDDELKMLCYAGACRLPVVLLVQGLTEATERADLFEQETRALLDSSGCAADETLFVYAKTTPAETLLHLYRRLDESLSATPEVTLPPLKIKGNEFDVVLFVFSNESPFPEKVKGASLDLPTENRKAIHTTLLRRVTRGVFHALVLRLSFDISIALVPEKQIFGSVRFEDHPLVLAGLCVVVV